MTREEHLKICKQQGAMAMLFGLACQQAQAGDTDGVRRFIEGFN